MVLVLVFPLIILWFVYDRIRYSKYPPGPIRFPIVGNLVQLVRISKYPNISFLELSKKYGDFVFVRMGVVNVITCNSFETIKFIRTNDLCLNRAVEIVPALWERQNRKHIGINFANGEEQKILRKFTARTLRDFGFGRSASMDTVINEELEKFTTYIQQLMVKNPGGIDNSDRLFDLTATNVSWRLVTGINYPLDDKKMLKLLRLSDDSFRSMSFSMDLSIAFPFLYHMFPTWMRKTEQKQMFKNLTDFVKETIEYHRGLGSYKTNPKSFVDVFLAKIDEDKDKSQTAFRDEQLVLTLLDLLQDSSHTTSNTIGFCMLYMICFPEVQKRIQCEIDTIIKPNESIISATKKRLPYTFAALTECLRYSTILPTPSAGEIDESFYHQGHLFEKGAYVLPNVYAVHFSEKLWGDPQNFRPERFLDNNGQVDSTLLSYVIPFNVSPAPRMCLGISLAESFLFIYFVSILRKFKVVKGDNSPELNMEPDQGITQSVKPYQAKYVARH